MATTKKQPKAMRTAAFRAEVDDLEAAVEANLPRGASVWIGGECREQAAILTSLRDLLDLLAFRTTAEEKCEEARAEWREALLEARLFVRAVKAALLPWLEAESPALAILGISPDRLVPASPPLKFLPAAKRAITRERRETGGRHPATSIPGGKLPWVH